ncbi:hypothetical protein K435DRAFT_867016 [Dendrothele bispora CBS 962.96]|uniref:Uncharacterized protein n=1 Tax=Dendrothele bispora (strain CBS 962.96) TaxID=1314807 RepID=A0A4S8LFQ9_DENBC|nr:hypothetical protein K435DRAFT_867016 [Dendrothele bispora CBS 962.96]
MKADSKECSLATLGHRGPFWSKFWGDWRSKYPSKLTAEEKKEVEELIVKYNLAGRGHVKQNKVETEDEDEDEGNDGNEQEEKQKDHTQLQSAAVGSAPRLFTDYKYYQKHPEHREKIDESFQEKYGKTKGNWKPNLLSTHVSVAKNMFDNENDKVKKKMRQGAKEEYEKELEAWKKKSKGSVFDMSDPEEVDK